jgi:hypothetical protein
MQALAMIGGILVMLYGGNSLAPALVQARDGHPATHGGMHRLHRRAARLNALVIVVGILLLVSFATRPRPRTSGIIEMSPAERFRYDAAITRVIEDVEAKYGLRPPRAAGVAETGESGPSIDAETVKEIESYYARKRLRDQARVGRAPIPPASSGAGTAAGREPSTPASTHPMDSGKRRVD